MTRCAALLVAAPASGQGKTTLTSALARLHTRAGRRVRVFKCGPDFLDPFWHQLASQAPVHQVDLWMTGETDVRQRLHQAAQEADLILVEGVMGLYDGEPSAADLARLLGLPVLAVVDASAMAQTFGALAHGLRHYQTHRHGPLRWAGVLANRVASDRHADMLRMAVTGEQPADLTQQADLNHALNVGWLGALMRSPALSLPERHLGLVAAQELPDALQRLDAAADALAQTPLGRLTVEQMQDAWGVECGAPTMALSVPSGVERLLDGQTVAVARDGALCFIYEANLQTLRQLGADVVFFSPLADTALPPCDAVWLPGGYPELHAEKLGANHALRDALRTHVAQGKPVWAECGGMMLLFDELVDKVGTTHAMWGLLPGRVVMQKRLAALGPQQLDLPGVRCKEFPGTGLGSLRGHTFHWSLTETPLQPVARTVRPGAAAQPVASGPDGEALYAHGPVRASYFHAWFPSAPAAVAALLRPEPLGAVA